MTNTVQRKEDSRERSQERVLKEFHLARLRRGGHGILGRIKSLSHRTKNPSVCGRLAEV